MGVWSDDLKRRRLGDASSSSSLWPAGLSDEEKDALMRIVLVDPERYGERRDGEIPVMVAKQNLAEKNAETRPDPNTEAAKHKEFLAEIDVLEAAVKQAKKDQLVHTSAGALLNKYAEDGGKYQAYWRKELLDEAAERVQMQIAEQQAVVERLENEAADHEALAKDPEPLVRGISKAHYDRNRMQHELDRLRYHSELLTQLLAEKKEKEGPKIDTKPDEDKYAPIYEKVADSRNALAMCAAPLKEDDGPDKDISTCEDEISRWMINGIVWLVVAKDEDGVKADKETRDAKIRAEVENLLEGLNSGKNVEMPPQQFEAFEFLLKAVDDPDIMGANDQKTKLQKAVVKQLKGKPQKIAHAISVIVDLGGPPAEPVRAMLDAIATQDGCVKKDASKPKCLPDRQFNPNVSSWGANKDSYIALKALSVDGPATMKILRKYGDKGENDRKDAKNIAKCVTELLGIVDAAGTVGANSKAEGFCDQWLTVTPIEHKFLSPEERAKGKKICQKVQDKRIADSGKADKHTAIVITRLAEAYQTDNVKQVVDWAQGRHADLLTNGGGGSVGVNELCERRKKLRQAQLDGDEPIRPGDDYVEK